ncbi:hypothetical protein PGQ11_013346 [Apiospora arundinis]|uniref:DUF7708 domain-containing protein n=1 Tax=Apiospora arundinis TaxID=335852 RepID=A0ABR2HNY3_9PEZI
MIPTNDKYVTLLTGSLSAIASACTNHEKLASGVSDSLEELSDDMAYWNDLIGLFPDQGMMQRYIMELYTVVFEFLTEIFTGWSKSPWTRFVASFNEQAFNKLFVEKRKRIKAMEHNMERHANIIHMQSSLNSQRDMGHQLSEFQTQVHTFTQVMQRLGTDVQSLLQANTTQMMSNLAIDSLDRSLEHPVTKLIEPEVAGTGLAHVGLVMDNTVEDINNNVTTDTIHCSGRCSVRDALALLEPIATQYNNSIQELVDLTTRALTVSVDLQIKRHLEAWKSSMTGNRIWVQGPHDVSHPSQNTLTAACLVGLANNAKIPFLSYFCSLKQQHQMSSPGLTPPDILLDMVKSLIVQLLLRQTSDAFTIDIPLTDFDRLLTGSDLDTALDVLHKLRGLVPSYCLCVIESVDVLEDRSDVAHTANLREVLREVINLGQPLEEKEKEKAEGNEGDSYKTVKILLTSNGHVDVLAVAAQGGFLEKIACDGDESGDGEQLGSLWDDDARSEEGG